MNTAKLRTKRVLIPSAALLAVLGVGGVAWATTAGADEVRGGERDRVAAAAVEAAGGGDATEVETSDDPAEAYEVEVRLEDGTEVDVELDEDLAVVSQETDDDRDDDGDDGRDDDGRDDDRALSDSERSSAERAATEAVGGGTVTDVEASDDRGVAYEVDVRLEDGTEWDVDLDEEFAVVSKQTDR